MRLIQFIFSVIIVGCTAGLLVHAILSQETFGKTFAIIDYILFFILSLVLAKLTYDEVRSF